MLHIQGTLKPTPDSMTEGPNYHSHGKLRQRKCAVLREHGEDAHRARHGYRVKWLVHHTNMTGSSVTSGLLKCSPKGYLTFSHYANSSCLMSQSPKALPPSSLCVIQNKYLKWHSPSENQKTKAHGFRLAFNADMKPRGDSIETEISNGCQRDGYMQRKIWNRLVTG